MQISTILLDIIAAMGAFLLVIGIHELGHFFMARRLDVPVLRLSLGFGKPLWLKKTKSGTEYCVAPILLGGYVQLLDEREGKVPAELFNKSLTRQPAWKRWAILGAGPLINFLLAVVLFLFVLSNGLPVLKPVIGKVMTASLAQKAGFQKGDILVAIENEPVSDWMLVSFNLIESFGKKGFLSIVVQHSNKQKALLKIPLSEWKLNPLKPDLLSSLGIQPSLDTKWMRIKKEPPMQALVASLKYASDYARINGIIIYKIVTRTLSIRSLAGPLALWSESAESLKKGFIYYCFFLGFLSVSIGAFNLLPIPGLDGFQMLIVLAEVIRRKPISTAFQVLMYQLGLIALSVLLVQVILNDVARTLYH